MAEMLDHCAPGWKRKETPHFYRVTWKAQTYSALPKGGHGKKKGRDQATRRGSGLRKEVPSGSRVAVPARAKKCDEAKDIWQARVTRGICYEVLRVVTHRRVFRRPSTAGEAWSFVDAVLASPALGIPVSLIVGQIAHGATFDSRARAPSGRWR